MKNYSRGGKDKGYSIHLPHIDKELMAYISSRPNWYAIAEVARKELSLNCGACTFAFWVTLWSVGWELPSPCEHLGLAWFKLNKAGLGYLLSELLHG